MIVSRLGGRNDVEARGHDVALAEPVLHVDGVVLPVGAEQAEEHRRPPAHAELLLLERLREVQLGTHDLVVPALRLRHAVHEHAVGRLGAARERNAPDAHESALRSASYADSPSRCSTSLRLTRPVKASLEPSPRTSTPARSRPCPASSIRPSTCCTGSMRRITLPPTGRVPAPSESSRPIRSTAASASSSSPWRSLRTFAPVRTVSR